MVIYFIIIFFMIVIDWEFTWLDPNIHSLVSLWAVDLYNPDNQFYWECRMWDWASYNLEALDINWFSVDDINDKSKKTLVEMIKDFDKWLKTCTTPQILIWQNPMSDIAFLKSSYEKAWLEYTLWHRSIDMHTVVFMKYLDLWINIPLDEYWYKINLDKAMDFVWIKWWEPKPHNALTWAKCEAEVIWRVMKGKKLLKEFKNNEVSEYLLRKDK